jgi:hypothetical protein
MSASQDRLIELFLGLETPLETVEARKEWPDYRALGLSAADIPPLLDIMVDASLLETSDEKRAWLPIHAWRALGQLDAGLALSPMLELMDRYPDDDWIGEWISEDLLEMAAWFGPGAVPALTEYLGDAGKEESHRIMVSEALTRIAQAHPEARDECIRSARERLERLDADWPDLNGFFVLALIELNSVESIGAIRRAYEADVVDWSICGDMEEVEIRLGLREKRVTPRPRSRFIDEAEGEDGFPPRSSHRETPSVETYHREAPKIGRNDPCPCGSGKKYKKCCLNKSA